MIHVLSLRGGLGTLPDVPPSSMLQAGKTWYRYLVSPGVQWTSCPSTARYGCTIYGGYAWGQWTGSEHGFEYIAAPATAPVSQTSTGTPTAATFEQQCDQELQTWYGQTARSTCLNSEDRTKIRDLCVSLKAKKITVGDYADGRQDILDRACVRVECERLYKQWAAAFPQEAKCLDYNGREAVKRRCRKGMNGDMSATQAAAETRAIIDAACAARAAPPPVAPPPVAPPPSNGGGGAPSPTDTGTTPEPGDVIPTSDAGLVYDAGADAYPSGEGAPSLLRQLGPVVGIGLLVAVGLTVATQQKRKKRRRARR